MGCGRRFSPPAGSPLADWSPTDPRKRFYFKTMNTMNGSCRIAWAAAGVLLLAKARAAEGQPGRELIRDPHFQRGFVLLRPKPGKVVPVGVLQGLDPGSPVWRLAQWNSRFSLAGVAPQRTREGGLKWLNAAKEVQVSPPGTERADLILGVNGSVEYDGRARKKGQPWPHLLVSQRFEDPPSLAEIEKAQFHVEVRLLYCRMHETPDYTPRLHAAQFLAFLSIQNLRRGSPGYGDFLYFGIPLYDSRYAHPHPFRAPDAAGKFIYTPAGTVYARERLEPGRWVTIDKDVLGLIRKALKEAWDRGFLADSRDPADYRIAAMNIGWEIPGMADAAIQVRNLSLRVMRCRSRIPDL